MDILEGNGFHLERQRGSHHIYEGYVNEQRKSVTVSYSRRNQDIKAGTLSSMIRQSGLPRKLFRR
ncbi:MAG: type II toxin-antitoxin system HicA family toxin [Chloroflexota bacterium]|nr:type II toxin-antitoxin system HicA family toxin [Chloroflexota bacterium]